MADYEIPDAWREAIPIHLEVTDRWARAEWSGSGWSYGANATKDEQGAIKIAGATGSASDVPPLEPSFRDRMGMILIMAAASALREHEPGSGDREWDAEVSFLDLL